MTHSLFFVYWHVNEHGCSCVFEQDGSAAMKFAMNLQNMGYRCRVVEEVVGKQNTCETIFESDDWLSLSAHRDQLADGTEQDVRNHG